MAFNLFDKVEKKLAEMCATKHMPPIPGVITEFLGKLSLLDGVPIHNLVPDERYLPLIKPQKPEEIEEGALRFFWLDPEWISFLLNGALSISDDTDVETQKTQGNIESLLLEKAMKGEYTAELFYSETKERIKRQLAGSYLPAEFEKELKKRLEEKQLKYGEPVPTVAQQNWCYTGFFIRSTLISSWAGIEITAYSQDNDTQRLQVIKLERVATDTVYCICEGIIGSIQITQPPETTHFDVEILDDVPLRETGSNVLDIKKILKVTKDDPSNSAILAEKLMAQPLKIKLIVNRK